MKRRTLLRAGAAVGAIALAGCTQPGEDPSDDLPSTDTETPEPTPEPTPTPTDSPEPSVGSTSFEVLDSSCGEGRNEATVSRDGDRVTVAGVIGGRNSCYTAQLQGVRYAENELRVEVESYQPDRMATCAQCLVDIDYEATVEVTGTPKTVAVYHNGERVQTT